MILKFIPQISGREGLESEHEQKKEKLENIYKVSTISSNARVNKKN